MRTSLALLLGLCPVTAPAQPPGPRSVPPQGIEVPAEMRGALEARLAELGRAIEPLRASDDPTIAALRPDVLIFHKAVADALEHGEFFKADEFAKADALLAEGLERAAQLAKGEAPWAGATGLVVRGYVSKIDGSVQPYGLVVPESYRAEPGRRRRLDIWFHGRGETLSEVNFLDERRRRAGQFEPAETIVLHPYGRYCNAFKFAGEVDVFEAVESVASRYPVDRDRVAVRGFSMGGAAAWHFAVHYPDRWFAANPGAGFAETPRFLRLTAEQVAATPWYERRLWHLYNATDWAENLIGLPTVAYSGELDRQKQAADLMADALRGLGVELAHVIGPKTEHKYHPDAAAEVALRLDRLAESGRARDPDAVRFVTYTLRYNRRDWLTIDALGEHWRRAAVSARVDGPTLVVDTENVAGLTLAFPPGSAQLPPAGPVTVRIDGRELVGPPVASDRSWSASAHREGDAWALGPAAGPGPRKRHGLQGPIDDAFMDSFLFVLPDGSASREEVGRWVEAEADRAIARWRRQFRGDARVKRADEVTDEDVAGSNLVLWGDPASNSYLRSIADRLPIAWGADAIVVDDDRSFPADHHVALLIAPNPGNPDRYVVLNSGPTQREADDLNNARQVPRLPDWAIVDIRTPPDADRVGAVVAADFFGEGWKVSPPGGPAVDR